MAAAVGSDDDFRGVSRLVGVMLRVPSRRRRDHVDAVRRKTPARRVSSGRTAAAVGFSDDVHVAPRLVGAASRVSSTRRRDHMTAVGAPRHDAPRCVGASTQTAAAVGSNDNVRGVARLVAATTASPLRGARGSSTEAVARSDRLPSSLPDKT